MISILILVAPMFFIYRYYAELAFEHNRSRVGFGILGIKVKNGSEVGRLIRTHQTIGRRTVRIRNAHCTKYGLNKCRLPCSHRAIERKNLAISQRFDQFFGDKRKVINCMCYPLFHFDCKTTNGINSSSMEIPPCWKVSL